MKSGHLFHAAILVVMLFSFIMPASPAAASAQENQLASVIPGLESPVGTIPTKTPTFTWNKVKNATNYQYQVYQGSTKLVDKSIASSTCGTSTCSNKPAYPFGYEVFKWRARAKVANVWKGWSAYSVFTISAPSFNSSFNGSSPGWGFYPNASFWHTDANYLYTSTHFFDKGSYYYAGEYTDFDYSMRISYGPTIGARRFGLFVRAGDHLQTDSLRWCPGYYFYLSDRSSSSLKYGVSKIDGNGDEIVIKADTSSAAITSDWNTLRVVAYEDVFLLYINNILVHYFRDSAYSRGYIGFVVSGERVDMGSTFRADWAKIKVLASPQE